MSKRRVVVTGLGAICPLGNSVSDIWGAAKAGRSGISRITKFDVSSFPTQIAGEIKNFDPTKYLEHKEVKKHDPFSHLSMAAAAQAIEDSKITSAGYPAERIGCILGIGIGGISSFEKYHQAYLEGGIRKISPFLIPAMISNLGPGNIAIKYGFKGVNYTITSACTSATHAIGESWRMIREGIADVMVTGGAESAITPIGIGGFCAMKALSTRNDEPEKASRPFDRDRDGFVMGEGSAVMVLESLDRAVARGASIYGEVVGYGASCDAFHITAPCEGGEGAIQCMQAALASAGLEPAQISYVNAHGTSTDANDRTESMAIKSIFGSWAKEGLVVSSTKSMTGHLLGAAGAIEALFSVLAIRDGVVPPTINLDNPAEGCDLDYVPRSARAMKLEYAISNSFGFGGTNATIVLGRV